MTALINRAGAWVPLVDPLAAIGGNYAEVKEIHAYHGTDQRTLVWSRDPMSIAITVMRWDTVRIVITPPGPGADSYNIYRNSVLVHGGVDLLVDDKSNVMPATTYHYRVDAIRSGVVVSTDSRSVKTPEYPALGLTATATAYDRVQCSWAALDGSADQAVLDRSSTNIYQGPGTSKLDTGRSASTSYTYKLQHRRAGVVLREESRTATTPARPIVKKVVTLSPAGIGGYGHGYASYNGAGTGVTNYSRRTDTSNLFVGQYSTNRGNQRSLVTYSVPPEIRNCIRITRAEISVKNVHSYNASGMTAGIVVHHGYLKDTWPGSTGVCGTAWASKGGWLGGSEWLDITSWVAPNRYSIPEEFRRWGALGMGFTAPTSAQKYYGYFANNYRLRLTYEVYG